MSTNKEKYNVKYKFPRGTAHSKRDISRTTGIPVSILDEVYDRGVGARKSKRADKDLAEKVKKKKIKGYMR